MSARNAAARSCACILFKTPLSSSLNRNAACMTSGSSKATRDWQTQTTNNEKRKRKNETREKEKKKKRKIGTAKQTEAKGSKLVHTHTHTHTHTYLVSRLHPPCSGRVLVVVDVPFFVVVLRFLLFFSVGPTPSKKGNQPFCSTTSYCATKRRIAKQKSLLRAFWFL